MCLISAECYLVPVTFVYSHSHQTGYAKDGRRVKGTLPFISNGSVPFSHDAASLLFKAIAERGDDVLKVIGYFSDFQGFDGATGHIERRDGKTVIGTSYYVVREGKIYRLD